MKHSQAFLRQTGTVAAILARPPPQGFKFGVDHEMQHSIVNFEPLEDSIVLDHICPLVLEYPQRVSDTYLRVCRNYTARHPAASDGDGDSLGAAGAGGEGGWPSR